MHPPLQDKHQFTVQNMEKKSLNYIFVYLMGLHKAKVGLRLSDRGPYWYSYKSQQGNHISYGSTITIQLL